MLDICVNLLLLFLQAQGHGLPLQSNSRSCILSASLPIKLDMDSVGLHHKSAASRRALGAMQVQAKVAAVTVLQEEVSRAVQLRNAIQQHKHATRFMHDSKSL